MRKLLYLIIIIGLAIYLSFSKTFAKSSEYALMKLEGSVNPIISEFLVKSIKKANDDKVQFILIQLDTPGGLVNSMRDIIKSIMTSDVPVVVYTSPKGAQAASAGGFIMLSAHLAVMAPGTEIGAMHPVSPSLDFMKKDKKGGPEGVMEKKVLNDIVAYGRSLAQKRNRNIKWTVDAIKNAKSSTYKEALAEGIIDFIAEDKADLLKKLHNRKVNVNGKNLILKTNKITETKYLMDWKENFLNKLADPQIVFILFILAVAGIGIEFKSPGMIVPGVLGGISLIFFLMAVNILPINIVGLLLIILAIVLFILELQIPSYGLLTIGGIVSFVFGSMILIDSPLPGAQIPLSTIIGSVLFILAIVFIVVRAVLNVHKTQVSTGKEGLIGEEGEVIRGFIGKGKIKLRGEIWDAVSDEEISDSDVVVVTAINGMNLKVKKKINNL